MSSKRTYGKKWSRMAQMYVRFVKDMDVDVDLSEDAAVAMYRFETFGEALPKTAKLNGYAQGKKWMDVTVAMWKEDILEGYLLVSELQGDEGYPDWFLERVGVLHTVPTPAAMAWREGMWLKWCRR